MELASTRTCDVDPDRPGAAPSRRAWLQGAVACLAAARIGHAFAQPGAVDAAELAGPYMPYAAFERLPAERIEVVGGVIRVAFGPGTFTLPRTRLLDHVRRSAASVVAYYGRFPARDTRVLILATSAPGRAIRSGTAFGHRGAAIKLTLSEAASEADLRRDWVLVHEMTHLALPSLPQPQHWFEEGIASYVEPLARAQAGELGADEVWAGMVTGMPRGLPQAGDRGLDRTPTWGRTYWGGALFCLLADLEIRERSRNTRGLQHALRAVLGHGNMETDSALEPLLRIGDAAVGLDVLTGLYARMRDDPYPVDLDALWRRMGVRLTASGVTFDDSAPLAAVRHALTAPYDG